MYFNSVLLFHNFNLLKNILIACFYLSIFGMSKTLVPTWWLFSYILLHILLFLVVMVKSNKKWVPLPSVRPVTLMQPLTDLIVCEGDIAQLEVRFSQENVEGTWMKNGQAISASERIHIVIDKMVHKLLVENISTEDAALYSFVVPAQDISTSGKLSVQSKS